MDLLALALVVVPQAQVSIPIREVLVVPPLGERRRSAVVTDGLEAALLHGVKVPSAGELVRAADGSEHRWEAATSDEDGWFSGPAFRKGWASATVDVPTAGPYRLVARGHSSVLVNGEPRGGDVYNLGTTALPMALAAGTHHFLFRCGRGRLHATLEPLEAPIYVEERDRTLPDLIRGESEPLLAGLLVSNASNEDAWGYRIVAEVADERVTTPLPRIHASSQRKCRITLPAPSELGDVDEATAVLSLVDRDGETVHRSEHTLRVRRPDQKHVRTFESAIDGSVQYYAVTPPPAGANDERTEPPEGEARAPALVLTLHGAGVEASGQANAYQAKPGTYIVAPTNRRPFGFDWEDWGRLDALEVLAHAERRFGTDPRRTYLTGHSMGGHGTWQIGALFPDRFAAIAPSAGWRDFWAYGGGGRFPEDDAIGALFTRATNASRTLLLEDNYRASGIYVLHGDADETVSVKEARAMRARLAEFHPNFAYYERGGAGHWWGNQCMDWPPLFAFLERNELPEPENVTEVSFTTVHPGISSRSWWLTVEAQERALEVSRVHAGWDREAGTVHVDELVNVARFAVAMDVLGADGPLTIRIGEHELVVPAGASSGRVVVEKRDGAYALAGEADPTTKGPHRYGPFKDAFRNRMVFVYGTNGNDDENAWAFTKARFDHETWRYRGNGAVDLVADVDFDPELFAERSVILYGNADTNGAWRLVLDPPFELRNGSVRVGERALEGDDLAFLAVAPRMDSERASVAVIGGTGLAGSRLTNDLPYFVSGVGYPDWTVLGPKFLTEGLAGVRGAGYFDRSWSVDAAETAWRDAAHGEGGR